MLFSVTFFTYYPTTYAITDEAAYLSTAYTFERGTIFYDEAGIVNAPMGMSIAGHYISKWPPGNAALLLPFSIIHWKLVFLRGYLLMALGFWIFILLLRNYKLPQIYALLFLFHPSFILYSRTIMSDVPAAIIALAGIYFLVKQKYFLAGILMGMGVSIRFPLLLLPIASGVMLFLKKNRQYFIYFTIGAAVSIIPLIVYNFISFHVITGSIGFYKVDFSFRYFWHMFKEFFFSLNILYPLLLILPFFLRKREKWVFIIPALVFIVFYSLQSLIDRGESFFESIVLGQRFMLPIIPFLLIPYIAIVSRTKLARKAILPFCGLLLMLSIAIHSRHQEYLKLQVFYRNEVYKYAETAALVVCNKGVYELINPYIKYIPWLPFESQGSLLPAERYSNIREGTYLMCIAHNEKMRTLFLNALSNFSEKEEIHTSISPYYFSVWRVW